MMHFSQYSSASDRERRELNNVFRNPDVLSADHVEGSEGADRGHEAHNKITNDNVMKNVGARLKSSEERTHALDKRIHDGQKRTEQTLQAAAKQRPSVVSTSAAAPTQKQVVEREETDRERASRKHANDLDNAVAGGVAKFLTGGLAPSGDAQLKERRVKEVVGDSSSTEQAQDKKKAALDQPIAKQEAQPEQKTKAAQEPDAKQALESAQTKAKTEDIAKQTGVKEIQRG